MARPTDDEFTNTFSIFVDSRFYRIKNFRDLVCFIKNYAVRMNTHEFLWVIIVKGSIQRFIALLSKALAQRAQSLRKRSLLKRLRIRFVGWLEPALG